jgi:hypothetical protein
MHFPGSFEHKKYASRRQLVDHHRYFRQFSARQIRHICDLDGQNGDPKLTEVDT